MTHKNHENILFRFKSVGNEINEIYHKIFHLEEQLNALDRSETY